MFGGFAVFVCKTSRQSALTSPRRAGYNQAMKEECAVYTYTVTKDDIAEFCGGEKTEMKASDYLRRKHNYSSRVLKTVKYDGGFFVDGKEVFLNTPVRAGASLRVCLKPEHPDCEAEDISVEILFENEDMLIANKPPFMLTHPTKNVQSGTLANALYYHWQKNGFNGKAHFVSRLDMNTSGIVTVAKNKYIHHFLQEYLSEHSHSKHYLAVVCGVPKEDAATISVPISYSGEGIKREASAEGREAKECITEYESLATDGTYSLLRLCLVTGRTHQLRVHLSHIGCPILGDSLYNTESPLIARQALHAFELSIPDARTKKTLYFKAPVFDDMQRILDKYFKL